ncbi:hypothetical protein FEM03_23780 [Phragmitibacter flavus]|uniref:Uncharacterized protein n=1 Tax=Phragmitibacter flavus TaxID=2576071 RepID=A0A5R8K791_9BACT|nr:hypothetical protein [Phragmitibacter flavus]TLD68231.1 hypothetical protein FEM03_23780 [Phragmitibacter flavus]
MMGQEIIEGKDVSELKSALEGKGFKIGFPEHLETTNPHTIDFFLRYGFRWPSPTQVTLRGERVDVRPLTFMTTRKSRPGLNDISPKYRIYTATAKPSSAWPEGWQELLDETQLEALLAHE